MGRPTHLRLGFFFFLVRLVSQQVLNHCLNYVCSLSPKSTVWYKLVFFFTINFNQDLVKFVSPCFSVNTSLCVFFNVWPSSSLCCSAISISSYLTGRFVSVAVRVRMGIIGLPIFSKSAHSRSSVMTVIAMISLLICQSSRSFICPHA